MAEYYPLISRAVAGLREGSPDARKAIYDRARQALVGQLRAMDPPVPEEAIARETAALDDAIARTEGDIVRVPAAGLTPGAETRPASPSPPSPQPKPVRPAADAVPKPPAWKRTTEAPSLGGADRDPVSRGTGVPAVESQPPAAAPAAPPTLPRSPLRIRGATPTTPDAKIEPPAVAARSEVAPTSDATPAMPPATTLRVEPIVTEAGAAERAGSDGDLAAARDRSRDEASRPAAPRPAEERRPRLRIWIVAVAALAAVVAIAVTAWRLRDNPADLSRTVAPQAAQVTPDKIAERAADAGAASTTAASDEPAQSTATAPASPADPETQKTTAAAATTPVPVATPAQTEATLPIAYKAAILVDAPDTPEKVKTYVGTVVWHAQSVPTGQGQPLGLAIQADISIPEADVQLMMQIRRNTETQLPASHTMDLKFTIGANSAIGAIKQVNVPQMRQQDMPTGDPLAGIPVTIADNYFLVGLVRGGSEDRNLDLLRSRAWFDIPLLLANGKASKITFEKGANGQHIFNDVLDSWKTAPN